MKNRKSLTFTTHHNKCSKLCIFCLKKKLCIFIKIKKKINTFASKTTPIKITTNNQVFGQSKSESSLPQKKKKEWVLCFITLLSGHTLWCRFLLRWRRWVIFVITVSTICNLPCLIVCCWSELRRERKGKWKWKTLLGADSIW
jgi:hypothetical protein